ncbi:MAG: histidinol-phosphatase [Chloroherpetonaceae bacterium]|nr:histidinol-phosphatase [Chloroherpetonaceae bacterium]MDW8437437.1 histidinol-phosphatase [Chloroherpetonaceae bacterium]
MTKELELALDVAMEAGKLTLRYFRQRSLKVERKRDRSPVTEADRNAEKLIRSALGKAFPKDGFLGEESGEKTGKSGRRWVIDPIDGTKSFIHGVPLYGVMIGLEAGGEVLLGVVNFPALNQIYYAEQGGGAFCDFQRLSVSNVSKLEDALLCATSEDYVFGDSDMPLAELRGKTGLFRTWGDCYGHCLVASGNAEIMIDPKMNPWDIAALLPIVSEAGGACFDIDGKPASLFGKGLVSANRALSETLLKKMRR